MPRKPIDYTKSCIYKIESNGIVSYVGSTTNFTNRKSQHKTCCNNVNDKHHNIPIYMFIRNNGGWDEFKMILIEKFKCNDSNELVAREQHWFNEFKPTLMNGRYPTRSPQQYRNEHKEKTKLYDAQYRKDNAEKIKIEQAQYRNENKEKTKLYDAQYRKDNSEKIKIEQAQYRKENIEKRKLYDAQYRLKKKLKS